MFLAEKNYAYIYKKIQWLFLNTLTLVIDTQKTLKSYESEPPASYYTNVAFNIYAKFQFCPSAINI